VPTTNTEPRPIRNDVVPDFFGCVRGGGVPIATPAGVPAWPGIGVCSGGCGVPNAGLNRGAFVCGRPAPICVPWP
jgi:hypothetical protein